MRKFEPCDPEYPTVTASSRASCRCTLTFHACSDAFRKFGSTVAGASPAGRVVSMAALVGVWLWLTGALRQLMGVPMSVLVPLHLATTVLCRSTGALALLACGLGCLLWMHLLRAPALMLCAALAPALFIAARIAGWEAGGIVAAAHAVSPARAQSLQARIDYEDMLVEKAPALGYKFTDPYAYVDFVERVRDTGTADEELARRVQKLEWELLFAWCFRAATGQG